MVEDGEASGGDVDVQAKTETKAGCSGRNPVRWKSTGRRAAAVGGWPALDSLIRANVGGQSRRVASRRSWKRAEVESGRQRKRGRQEVKREERNVPCGLTVWHHREPCSPRWQLPSQEAQSWNTFQVMCFCERRKENEELRPLLRLSFNPFSRPARTTKPV